MRRELPSEVPVLIAGAGPAGLTTAIALARAGVECMVVERSRDMSALPRATVVSTRSMEMLRAWGLEDEVRAGAADVEMLMWECETLARAGEGHALEVGYPTAEQSAAVSPTGPACVPQDHLEPVMLRHLASLPAAHVHFGMEVAGVEQLGVPAVFQGTDHIGATHRDTGAGGGIVATLRDVATGEQRRVWARYLVAADGAHSSVRSLLGIPMRGPDHLADSVLTIFRAPLWDVVGEHRYVIYSVGPEDVFLPAGPGERWLIGTGGTDVSPARIAERIRRGADDPDMPLEIERVGRFSFAAQLAERFRGGDAFLVGDAAHRVSPRGGTGMNTAIGSGYDLGWKLAWVLNGWDSAGLLDSYEAERRPVAEQNVTRSADPNGSLRTAAQGLAVDLGGRIPHVRSAGRSTLDMLGPGLTLFTGPGGAPDGATSARGPIPLVVRPLDDSGARALGIDGDEGLLVRPDGVPVDAERRERGWDVAAMSTRTT